MKHMIKHLTGFVGIIALSVIMACSFAACEQEPDPFEIPAELKGTTWVHRDGDTISFDTTNVKVKTQLGIERTFTLKETSSVNGNDVDLTILYFNLDNKIIDTITCHSGVVNMVNLCGINKAGNWYLYNPNDVIEDENVDK